MGKQYNKIQKRRRRQIYLERTKSRRKRTAWPKLRYRTGLRQSTAVDPFEKSDIAAPRDDEVAADRTERFERLLAWLSAAGCGSWVRFAEACEALGLTDLGMRAGSVSRRLRLLGHIEVSTDGQQWTIAPSVCVTSANDASVRYFAGARTPRWLTTAEDPALIRAQPGSWGPARIELPEGSELPCACGVAGQASFKLAEHLVDLNGWKTSLQRLDRVNAMIGRVHRWDGQRFVEDYGFIDKPGPQQSPSGLYQLIRGDGEMARHFTAFFDAPAEAWLRADWYGLAFLALHETGVHPVIYDSVAGRLLVLGAERWPLIYEKALVLASGFLPSRSGANRQWLSYRDVPISLAQQLAVKLNVQMEVRDDA